jgi:hypothetical protein
VVDNYVHLLCIVAKNLAGGKRLPFIMLNIKLLFIQKSCVNILINVNILFGLTKWLYFYHSHWWFLPFSMFGGSRHLNVINSFRNGILYFITCIWAIIWPAVTVNSITSYVGTICWWLPCQCYTFVWQFMQYTVRFSRNWNYEIYQIGSGG